MATLRRKRVDEAEGAQDENAQTSLGLEEQVQEGETSQQENSEKAVVRKKRVVKVKAEYSSETPAAEETENTSGEAAPQNSENNPSEEHNFKKNQSYYNNK